MVVGLGGKHVRGVSMVVLLRFTVELGGVSWGSGEAVGWGDSGLVGWVWCAAVFILLRICQLTNNKHGVCEHLNNTYIGMTTTTLSRRLTMHLASGGPKQHALTKNHMPLTREELVNNTQIIFSESNNNKLSITEALLIQKMQPSINTQYIGINRTLKLFT